MPSNVCVALRGSLAFRDLPRAYADAGILVFPTLADDWGMVVNEALASGVPVLGSRYAQAVEDLCVEGETGWMFRPDQGDEMERALDAALDTSPEALDEMRRAARERVATLTSETAANVMYEAVVHALERR
jgi:glycosyltransferase involved in cell wall biosynthesis